MASLRQYAALVRHLGLGWLFFRAGYAVRRRTGQLRRATPAVAWAEVPAPELQLRVRLQCELPGVWDSGCLTEADAVLRGEFRLFSDRVVPAGSPPNWHRNQLTGEIVPSDRHWTELRDFAFGDIKGVWELSRFSWAFLLVRACARTGENRYADGFWQLFTDWFEHNPPNLGPNWMCGQEATFRLMAVVFAAEGLGMNAEQRIQFSRFVVATGRRIAANLDYALSQKNNHGVSECVGLITAALCIPTHSESAGWLERGTRKLQGHLGELVYPDGSFCQHSLIYHRVLLHDLAWTTYRWRAALGREPEWLRSAASRALGFMDRLVDPRTGGAPLFGANDGADILPLAEASFLDLRPMVQLGAALFRGELPLPAGPWDEAAAWLAGEIQSFTRVV